VPIVVVMTNFLPSEDPPLSDRVTARDRGLRRLRRTTVAVAVSAAAAVAGITGAFAVTSNTVSDTGTSSSDGTSSSSTTSGSSSSNDGWGGAQAPAQSSGGSGQTTSGGS
jgi:hypothetical protein